MNIDYNSAAGETKEFIDLGTFFRLLEADAEVTVFFYRNGAEVARVEKIKGGYAEKFEQGFTAIKITSATAQRVQAVVRIGSEVDYLKQLTGNFSLTGQQGAFTQAGLATSTVSAQLLAAKANRRYLLVQNQDAANAVFLAVDGVAATATSADLKIPPGGSYVADVFCPTGAIHIIAAAGTPAVHVIEG